MAGKKDFIHECNNMTNINSFKKSIYDSLFKYEQIAMIFDFYVARSIAGQSGLSITLEQYGWKRQRNGQYDFLDIESKLKGVASITQFCCIRSNTIKDTLNSMKLSNDIICIEHPRIVLQQDYKISINENEEIKIESKESKINCLFRHIRNAFAHSNTYFFENGYMLLEDKEKSKITARILIKQKTLLDWILVIDKNHLRYTIKDVK